MMDASLLSVGLISGLYLLVLSLSRLVERVIGRWNTHVSDMPGKAKVTNEVNSSDCDE